jgi:hypothetical protein
MAQDKTMPGDRPAANVCPWCSAALAADAATCPSCGANLTADGEPVVPGLTAVDAEALLRSKQSTTPSRSRLMSWISGEYANETPTAAESQAVAPPDIEVRREILRLELEAEVARLQSEADAILAEAAVEGRVIEIPEGLRSYAPAEAAEVLEQVETGGTEASDETFDAAALVAEAPGGADARPSDVTAGDDAAAAPEATAQADTTEAAAPTEAPAKPPAATGKSKRRR